MSKETKEAFEKMKFYKFYPVQTPDTPDISNVKVKINSALSLLANDKWKSLILNCIFIDLIFIYQQWIRTTNYYKKIRELPISPKPKLMEWLKAYSLSADIF